MCDYDVSTRIAFTSVGIDIIIDTYYIPLQHMVNFLVDFCDKYNIYLNS